MQVDSNCADAGADGSFGPERERELAAQVAELQRAQDAAEHETARVRGRAAAAAVGVEPHKSAAGVTYTHS